MANAPDNFNPQRPDEADLLAWVEGERLSPEVDAAVARLLMSDPRLARQLELMRSDRLALQSLRDESAPGGLIDSVEAALQPVLERQLLIGLQQGEPVESRPVVSMVRSEKQGIFQTFLSDRAGRRMAMAASLLVLIGGATYVGTVMLSRGTPASPVGPIAILPERGNTDLKDTKSATSSQPGARGTQIAAGSPRGTTPVAPERTASPDKTPSVDAPITVASNKVAGESETPLVGPVKTPMDPALAAELARDRKLVIRVISSAAARTPSVLADRMKKETASPAWRLSSEVSSELAAALKPEGDVNPSELNVTPAVPPPAFASDDTAIAKGLDPTFVGPPASAAAPIEFAAATPSVYIFQTRLDAATLSQLRSTLQRVGRADDVVFEEQRDALPLDPNAPILVPGAILWWDNGPAGWTNWGEVPVVIDPNR